MRKDVKIGLAIAGVLFAVLIVYAFVPKKDTTQTAAGDNGTQQIEGDTAYNTGTDPGAAPADSGAAPHDAVASKGGNTGNDVFDPNYKGAAEPEGATAGAGGSAGNTDWLKTFDQDKIVAVESHPPLIATKTPVARTTTPPPAGTGAQGGQAITDENHGPGGPPVVPLVGDTGTSNNGAGSRQTGGAKAGGGGATNAGNTNAKEHAKGGLDRVVDPPPPSARTSAGGTHVVQKDETFSTIAKAVYGKKSYYLQIQKANPTVNPNKLKPGTTIVLPDIADAASSSKAAAEGAKSGAPVGEKSAAKSSEPAVNPSSEYRVQSGDSLYKISVKLYGNGSHAEELYDNNVKTIGDDPAKLKVGTVLKLHDAPRVKQAAR